MLKWLILCFLLIAAAVPVAARHNSGTPGIVLGKPIISNSTFTGGVANGAVGTLSATISDGSALTWSLKGANSGGFVVNANTGAVTQSAGGTPCGSYSDLRAQVTSPTAVNSAQYVPLILVSGSCISGINMSNTTFPIPSSGVLATLSATCSVGSCTGATFQLATQAGCTSTDNAAFTISGTNVSAASQINDTTARHFCVEASLTGAQNFFQSLTLTGTGSTGGVPALANGAGFTTDVVNSDFTQAKYANQANWLNCNPHGSFSPATNPEWHRAWGGFGNEPLGPCSAITQQVDPFDGKPSIQLHWDDAYCTRLGTGNLCVANNGWPEGTLIQPTNADGLGTPIPPNAYFEVVARYDTPATFRQMDNWTLGNGAEWDGIEVYASTNASSSNMHNCGQPGCPVRSLNQDANNHTSNTCPTCAGDIFPNGIDVTKYHKYAWRITSDGSTDGWWCGAIDDVPYSCDTWVPSSSQLTNPGAITMQLSAVPQNDVNLQGTPFNVWLRSARIISCSTNSTNKCYTSQPNPPLQ
jgi:hypothetical protein